MPPEPGGVAAGVRRRADRTPAHRDRHIDLLRALALCAVVFGHWTLAVIVHDRDGLHGFNLLQTASWTHPLTWLFQVMPVFFLVGGYANAASLDSHRRRGGDAASWLLGRTGRLVRPTTALLATVAGVALLATWYGVDPALTGMVAWLATLPLWFLVTYLAMIALAPLTHALHRRWGRAVPAVLGAGVLLLDLARLTGTVAPAAEANNLLAWLAIHQLGFCWRDGLLPRRPATASLLAAGGLTALVLLTTLPFSPYPVSMVDVPGAEDANASPPTVALLALAVTQLGVVLALDRASNRWLTRRRPWRAVVALNSVVLTLFLWHMTAVVIGALLLYGTGLMPQPEPGSGPWLLLRVPWLLCLAVVLAVLVAAVSRIELRTPAAGSGHRLPDRRGVWHTVTAAGLAVLLVGLAGVTVAGGGDDGPAGLPVPALLLYAAGAAALRLARRRPRPAPEHLDDRSG